MKYWAMRFLSITARALVMFWAGIAGWMTSDRTIPVRVDYTTVLTPRTERGGVLKIEYQVYRDQQCRTLIERTIFDSKGTRLYLPDIDYETVGPLGRDTFTSATVVPLIAEPGWAKYRVTLSYSCNVIQRLFWPIVDQRPDIPFYISAEIKESSLHDGEGPTRVERVSWSGKAARAGLR